MRNILDVAPSLAEYFIDVEPVVSNGPYPFDSTNNILSKYRQYLGQLHDSWILKAETSSDRFTLQLNDFVTHVFADALISKKGLKVDEEKLVFKIDIEFEVDNITYNTVDENGAICQIDPINIDEYLYEEILSINESSAEIGLVVWKSRVDDNPGHYILILINATKVILHEHQDSDWNRVFSNKFDSYYNCFKSKLEDGVYLSDQSICAKLIDEIDGNSACS